MYSSAINQICLCVSTRYVQAQTQVARQNTLPTLTSAGQEVIVGGYSIPGPNPQMEQLIKENERLKREVESYSEKAARLQKVIPWLCYNMASLNIHFLIKHFPFFFQIIFFTRFLCSNFECWEIAI